MMILAQRAFSREDAGRQAAFRPGGQNLEKTKFGLLDLVLS
jgi:hypothetical protein